MPSLFDPIKLGAINCPNRILMAPLTRTRATREHVPTPIMRDYYVQRASAGLIISEAVGISRVGMGTPFAPGIWTDEQMEAWKPIVGGVHEAGGRIICQLWHMGRLAHSTVIGETPVSSSATAFGEMAHTYEGRFPYDTARPLELHEIPDVIDEYARAAGRAIAAGFDGVQIHAANGYLIDQFLRDGVNHRDDDYGGSIENRTRLLRQVTAAVVDVVGADRTSVRLSPNGEVQGVNDSNPEPLFTAAAELLDEIGIAFLELREPRPNGTFGKGDVPPVAPAIRKAFRNPLVLNSDYDAASGQAELDSGVCDAIAYGRPYIANPDLVERFAKGAEIAPDNMRTWYTPGEAGYTDYPTMDQAAAA